MLIKNSVCDQDKKKKGFYVDFNFGIKATGDGVGFVKKMVILNYAG